MNGAQIHRPGLRRFWSQKRLLRLRCSSRQCQSQALAVNGAIRQKNGNEVYRADKSGRHSPAIGRSFRGGSSSIEPFDILGRGGRSWIKKSLEAGSPERVDRGKDAETGSMRTLLFGGNDHKTGLFYTVLEATQRPFPRSRAPRPPTT